MASNPLDPVLPQCAGSLPVILDTILTLLGILGVADHQ